MIRGQVVGPDGRPVPGATVIASRRPAGYGVGRRWRIVLHTQAL